MKKQSAHEGPSGKGSAHGAQNKLPLDRIIRVLAIGKHEIWYRVDDHGVIALHKPMGLEPVRLHFSSLESLQRDFASTEQEFDRACPGCAEARTSPMLVCSDIEAVYGAETTLDGHRFRVYRERFEDGHETITVVHTNDGTVDDYCYENAAALDSAWSDIIGQVNATCAGCAQQGE